MPFQRIRTSVIRTLDEIPAQRITTMLIALLMIQILATIAVVFIKMEGRPGCGGARHVLLIHTPPSGATIKQSRCLQVD